MRNWKKNQRVNGCHRRQGRVSAVGQCRASAAGEEDKDSKHHHYNNECQHFCKGRLQNAVTESRMQRHECMREEQVGTASAAATALEAQTK